MRLLLILLLAATPALGRTLNVGAGQTYPSVSAAVAGAHDGDVIDVFPGVYYDCASVTQNDLTIQGTGAAADSVLTDRTCQSKAILVLSGRNTIVKNLTLQRARVPDANGAGIRAEGGDLTVDTVRFINDQDGILSGDLPGVTITVTNSLFQHDGICQYACAHGLYAGHIAALRVSHSSFLDTQQGHAIKSRAALTEVVGCTIEDGPTGTSSYLIEAPNGGSLIVRGNTLEKGPHSGNHLTAISIGAEGVTQPTDRIEIDDNHFTNDGAEPAYLLVNITATDAHLRGNTLAGRARPLSGDGQVR